MSADVEALDENDLFWKSTGGKALAASKGYLQAASIVRGSDEWTYQASILVRPTAHLVGHSLELFLKFPHLARGQTSEAVAKRYGHDLSKLWDDPMAKQVRLASLAAASEVWEQASASGKWPTDDFRRDPRTALAAAVRKLSDLHGRRTNYALRYPTNDEETIPRTMFMIEAFNLAVEAAVQDPQSFYD